MTAYEQVKQVRDRHQATDVHGITVDATTAAMLIAVHDGLKPESQAKFEAMIDEGAIQLVRLVDFGWKHVR